MKKYLTILILCVLYQQCSAQTQIIDLRNDNGDGIEGSYYKDINNDLDYYVGTWIYNNGSKYVKLIIQKKIKYYNTKYYEDLLIGGLEYKENGITKINTLTYLNNNLRPIEYSISGNSIYKNHTPKCLDCFPNELRLGLSYHELNPETSFGSMILRKITVNGQNVIKLNLKANIAYQFLGEPEPVSFKLPVGEYIFIKQ